MLMLFVACWQSPRRTCSGHCISSPPGPRRRVDSPRSTVLAAIRRYVKKTGRYPSRLEELENTNNIRFLRKRYKDPLTNKDFKVLHVGEVQLTGAAGIAGAAALGGAPYLVQQQ